MTLEVVDADGFAPEESGAGLFILVVTRREIESGLWASALERLLKITDSAKAARSAVGCLAFSVSGYDSDPRSLAEIPEVRIFFRGLSQAWPFWATFLLPQEEVIFPLLAVLVDLQPGDVRGQFEVVSPRQAREVIGGLIAGHRRITASFDFPAGLAHQIEQDFLAACRNWV